MTNYNKFSLTNAIVLVLTLGALATQPALATGYSFSNVLIDPGSYTTIYSLNNSGQFAAIKTAWGSLAADAATGDGNNPLTVLPWQNLPWSNALNVPSGSTWNGAMAINDHGQIAGFTGPVASIQDMFYPTVWNSGIPTQLNDNGNGWGTYATNINNAGMVAGLGWTGTTFHTVYWNPGEVTIHDLGTLGGSTSLTFPGSLNDSGLIVGQAGTPDDEANHAAAWDSNGVHDLGTLGGANSFAYSVNGAGEIVGQANLTGDGSQHAAYWLSLNAPAVDLGTLGGANSAAQSINAAGQIVGWSETANGETHLTLWDHGQIVDLNQYIPASLLSAGLSITQDTLNLSALINDHGLILGQLSDGNGKLNPFFLTPTAVPVPGAVWLFGSALTGLIGLRRRR